MGTSTTITGGSAKVVIYGDGTVVGGNGNDSVSITGKGNVLLGNGNDSIAIGGNGTVVAGTGSDTIYLGGNGIVNLGIGFDTIHAGGSATVAGAFGKATITGGGLTIGESHGVFNVTASGSATLLGGSAATNFVGGVGADTFIGGSGHDTMTAGVGKDLFEFNAGVGGSHVIKNFVHGVDQLYLEGYSLSTLPTADMSYSTKTGLTTFTLDHGATVITVNGKITASDITTHKP